MSFIDYIVKISNLFIEWYNKQFNEMKYTYTKNYLLDSNILEEVIIANNKIYKENSQNNIHTALILLQVLLVLRPPCYSFLKSL